MNTFFATCPRGLEGLLTEELQAVGATKIRTIPGGVEFTGDWSTCYKANLESRIATRILWFLAKAPYTREDDIYRLAANQPWEKHFDVTRTLRVQSTAIRCPLKSVDFVTLRVKDAICDHFRNYCDERPSIDTREPDVRVQVFLTDKECTLYLDTSGAPLWQRGLRHANVEAPLKENLAAGILKLSGWQPGTPLLDPMCGSGTFILEAACMALNRAPGLERICFGFENLNNFQEANWQKIRNAALERVEEATFQQIWASDLDERAVRATRHNLKLAGLEAVAQVQQMDFLDHAAPAPQGILVANPPYGERIGEIDALGELYPKMATTLKRSFPNWTAFFFTADTRFPGLLRLKPSRKTPLFNGPLECRLYEIRLVAGSNRKGGETPPPAQD